MILPPFAKSAQLSLSFADKFIQAMLSHISHTTLGAGLQPTQLCGQRLRRYLGSCLTFLCLRDKINKMSLELEMS